MNAKSRALYDAIDELVRRALEGGLSVEEADNVLDLASGTVRFDNEFGLRSVTRLTAMRMPAVHTSSIAKSTKNAGGLDSTF